MNIQDLKSNTTWQEASNTINNNNNKISLAIATLENAKLKNKGYFTTLEKLNEAVPNPTIGSKAYVGTSEPYAIYIVENGAWVDSGYTGGDEIVAKITTDRIEDGAVTSEKIATSAFDSTLSVSGKIAPADVVGGKLSELGSTVDELVSQINVGIINYNKSFLDWDMSALQGTITSISKKSVTIEASSDNTIAFRKEYQLADLDFAIGDTIYFGAKNVSAVGGSLALVMLFYNGTSELSRKSIYLPNFGATNVFLKSNSIIPVETDKITIRFQSTKSSEISSGEVVIAKEDFDENTIFQYEESLVERINDTYRKNEVNALLTPINSELSNVQDDISTLNSIVKDTNVSLLSQLVLIDNDGQSVYYKNASGKIASTSIALSNSHGYEPLDLTDYIGSTIYVKFGGAGTGTRISALCDADGNILKSYQETSYGSTLEFVPNATYHYLYICYPVTTTKTLDKLHYIKKGTLETELKSYVDNKVKDTWNKVKVIYVSPSGNDATGTGEKTSPFKTLVKALSVSNTIVMLDGVYLGETIIPNNFNYSEIFIKGADAKKVVVNFANTFLVNNGSETLVSGTTKVYQVSCPTFPFASGATHARMWQDYVNDPNTLIADADRHPLQRGKEYRCDSTLISQCTSILEIENLPTNTFGFYWENGVMYFSRPQASSVEHPIVIPQRGKQFISMNANNTERRQIKIVLNNIEVRYAGISLAYTSNCELSDIAVKYNYALQGLQGGCYYVYACTNCLMNRCEAAGVTDGGSVGDGFNVDTAGVNDNPTCKCLSLHMVDCWSHDNWDDGYSDHDNSEVVIDGGLFEFCGKGGVTPAYGSNDIIRNAVSRYNRGSGVRCAGSPTVSRKGTNIIAFNCVCYGQINGYYVDTPQGEITCIDCISYNNSVGYNAGNGVIYAKDCKTKDTTSKQGNVLIQSLEILS